MNKDIHDYTDIIALPHPVSSAHSPMSKLNRAAQFAPFAALTGYEDAIENTKERAIQNLIQNTELPDSP